ncbi:hypothetical protein RND71_021638 [Anisodus tanguticus]|uniref:Uncharacterized protein n=1 Tax=Anisodus tanguticus TaxID=243964 RepID=A0AAE1VFF0_9SOLA|nr:hypothetical protein RND71_021638 [Anisodus tanguticus]
MNFLYRMMRPNWPGDSNYRGRGGRGRGAGRGNTILQQGNKKLVNQPGTSSVDKDSPLYQQFMDFIKSRGEGNNPQPSVQPSYAEIAHDEQDDSEGYEKLNKRDVILILDNKDLERRDEPWKLMERYLEAGSYPILTYKSRMHYETILMTTGSADIQHYFPMNTKKVYNFSKIIIKKIFTPED